MFYVDNFVDRNNKRESYVCFVLQLWHAENTICTMVFGNGFPAITSLFFLVGQKQYHFLESVNYSTNDTAEALAISFNILFVEFLWATFL